MFFACFFLVFSQFFGEVLLFFFFLVSFSLLVVFVEDIFNFSLIWDFGGWRGVGPWLVLLVHLSPCFFGLLRAFKHHPTPKSWLLSIIFLSFTCFFVFF